MLRVATDIGGTFTDVAYFAHDPATGEAGPLGIWKADTRAEALSDGVLAALSAAGVALGEAELFAHGSTVVINTLLERKGVKTGLITTRGFRDVLEIARGNRPDLFNFRFRKPPPFVPRHLRLEVDERVDHRGEMLRPLDPDSLKSAIARLRAEAVEAVAVCFLHAYANPANEQAALDLLHAHWPRGAVIASHQTTREWREYERSSTAVLSAYVAPVVARYLGALQGGLRSAGLRPAPLLLQSNGGMTTVAAARRNPVVLAESGPVAGVLGAAALARQVGRDNLIALDVGGTTAKCALIEDGRPTVTTDYAIEASRTEPGYPIKTPVIDIVEIGTGGGSIAWLDEGGKLHVGPESAGARPGPLIYGRGGSRPTVTDAHVLTGRIDAGAVLGGRSRDGGPRDLAPLRTAFAALGAEVGASATAMALGVLDLAEVNMENALKLVSVNRGRDPRDFALVAYGGGGPLHATALARALMIPEVIVPVNAAAFAACGMLLADLRRDYGRTRNFRLEAAEPAEIAALLDELEAEARADFADGMPKHRLVLRRAADMRYRGQEHTVRVDLPAGPVDSEALTRWAAGFRDGHERLYGVRLDGPVEIVNLHLVAWGEIAKPRPARPSKTGATVAAALKGCRRIAFDRHGPAEAKVYARALLEPGMAITGPAVVEDQGTAVIVGPDERATTDDYGNLIIRMEA